MSIPPGKTLNRPCPLGRELGAHLARLTQPSIDAMAAAGISDDRCASCAFRLGTIPNGCIETQADALKSLMEGIPFYCHMKEPRVLCHGWYAGRESLIGTKTVMPWAYTTDHDADRPIEQVVANEDRLMSAAFAVAFGPRYVANAYDAIHAEHDEGKVICRGCLLIMEPTTALDDMEGAPLCPGCLQDKGDRR
jgi:hypothetical protein